MTLQSVMETLPRTPHLVYNVQLTAKPTISPKFMAVATVPNAPACIVPTHYNELPSLQTEQDTRTQSDKNKDAY